MKENKLLVQIKQPIDVVFEFTTNPSNTHKWIKSIKLEEANEHPIKLGTIYRNKDKSGKWNLYVVSKLENNKIFELVSEDKNYHVRYTYTKNNNKTLMEYFEWVDAGEIENPFDKETMDKLKETLESINL